MTGQLWYCAVRFALVVPRLLLTGPPIAGSGMLSLSGPPGPWLRRDYKNSPGNPDPLIRSSTGEPGLSLWHLLGSQPGLPGHAINAPSFTSGPIPARFLLGLTAPFLRPELPRFRGRKVLSRSLNRLAERSFRNPFGMTGGDPKHTRAEQEES